MSKTLSWVNLSEVFDHLGLSDSARNDILKFGFPAFSYGLSSHTLVSNEFAIRCIVDGLLPPHGREEPWIEELADKFWEFVTPGEFVNVED